MADTFHYQIGGKHYQVAADTEEEARQKALAAAGRAPIPAEEEQQPPPPPQTLYTSGLRDAASLAVDVPVGAADLALTMGSGALAEVGAGLVGTGEAVYKSIHYGIAHMEGMDGVRKALDEAANTVNYISDAFTWQPRSRGGQGALKAMGDVILPADNALRSSIEVWSGGNPEAAAAMYTGIYAIPEVLGLKAASAKGTAARAAAKKAEANIRKLADSVGVRLDDRYMATDIIQEATRRSPPHATQGAEVTQAALHRRRADDKAFYEGQVDALVDVQATIKASDAANLGKTIEKTLREQGYMIDDMPGVQEILGKLQAMNKRSPVTGARQALELEAPKKLDTGSIEVDPMTRRQIETDIKAENAEIAARNAAKADSVRADLRDITSTLERLEVRRAPLRRNLNKKANVARSVDELDALDKVETHVENYLDYLYNNSMIDGTPQVLQAWKEATQARRMYNAIYHEDKVISQLIDVEATPKQFMDWAIGRNFVDPKPGAAQTINKLKSLLGKDSPAIKGMRNEYVFKLFEPLLADRPDFKGFVAKYDQLIKKRPDMVQALDLHAGDIRGLRQMAEVANKLLPNQVGRAFSKGEIASMIARLTVGHGIARAAVRVLFATRLLSAALGKDLVNTKQFINALMDIEPGPAIPKSSPVATALKMSAVGIDVGDTAREKVER